MEENEFKKIIQKAGLDESPALFTDNIMRTIGMHEEVAKTDALGKLLQNAVLSNPAEDFTSKIMQQVAPQKQIVFQPIIGKRTWRIVAGLAAMVFSAITLTQIFSKKTVTTQSKLDGVFELNKKMFIEIAHQSSIVFICLISICVLLVIDSFVRKRVTVSRFV